MEKTIKYSGRERGGGKLLIMEKYGRIRVKELGAQCMLGRWCEGGGADIQINSGLVSKHHGEFFQKDGNYYYRDLNSLNGTYLNDILLGKETSTGNQSVQLKNGDVLRVDYGREKEHHPEAVVMVYTEGFPAGTEWEKQTLDETMTELSIGRSNTDIHVENREVSKKHASFFRAHRGWAVTDHDSTNGVFLNGEPLEKPKYIFPMDVIRIANLFFFYDGEAIIYPVEKEHSGKCGEGERLACAGGEKLVIQISEKSVWQRFRKLTLLKDTNLTVKPGEMVLILGGSGAGKTTFMNAVMGYEKAQGTILHGNTNIYSEYEKMKYEIGYVPQQDLLRGSDIVYNTINDAAAMKLPKSIGKAQRRERAEQIIDMVGLRNEAHFQVSKISGGQRKRLSVAVELVANPSLLFLDEADSGLDGPNSMELMQNVRNIADTGKIVMVITHAPDRVVSLFDKVIVLAKSEKDNTGRLAFFGPVREALRFFETDSMEGIVKKINRKDEGGGEGLADYFIEKYRALKEE